MTVIMWLGMKVTQSFCCSGNIVTPKKFARIGNGRFKCVCAASVTLPETITSIGAYSVFDWVCLKVSQGSTGSLLSKLFLFEKLYKDDSF